jgi:hypothetical protein
MVESELTEGYENVDTIKSSRVVLDFKGVESDSLEHCQI